MISRARFYLPLLGVFVLALSLRLAHLAWLESSWEGTHLFSLARGDAAHHWAEATTILDHDVWLRDRIPWKGPGYSYFLALLMTVAGRDAGTIRWALAILGSLNCVGLVLLARRFLPFRWSLVAGLLTAIHGVLILFDGELFFPTLLVTLNLAALLLLTSPNPGARSWVGAGVCLGLASLVHPVYLLPAAFLTLWLIRTRGHAGWVFAVAAALMIAPTTLENLLVRGQPVLISWSGGVNLYVGNQPAFDQVSGQGTAAWGRVLHTTTDAGIESEHERDRTYYRLAGEQAIRSPLTALRIGLTKARVLLSPVEIGNNVRIYEYREHSPVIRWTVGRLGGARALLALWIPFGLWAPPALAGLVLTLRKHPRWPATILAWWSAALALSILLSFNTARYRLPLVFFGCVWAAVALRWITTALARRDLRAIAWGAGTYLALTGGIAAMAVPQSTLPAPLEWSEAQAHETRGRLDLAEQWYRRAITRYPEDPVLALTTANFYGRHGRLGSQQELLRSILVFHADLEPDLQCLTHEALARSYLAGADLVQARHHVEAALALKVDDRDWHGAPYFRMGLVPSTACKLRVLFAQIELRADDPGRARALIGRVRQDCPNARRFEADLAELERALDETAP